MSTYSPVKIPVPNGLDEVGFKLTKLRLPGEDLPTYRKRLLDTIRRPSGPTEQQMLTTIGRQVGDLGVEVFSIDLLRDADDEPLAADPFIEITSTVFRAYSNYGSGVAEIEIVLTNSDGRWARDIYTAMNASAYFSIDIVDTDYTYRASTGFWVTNTERLVEAESLRSSRENKLLHELIIDVWGSNLTEEVALVDVNDTGQYYIDRTNGVLTTWDNGVGWVSYTYRQFPFSMVWGEVRAAPLNDADWKNQLYDNVLTLDGVLTRTALNSAGANYYNEVLAKHGLQWGE